MRERDAATEKLKLVSTGSVDRTGQSDIEGSSVRRGESILSGEQTVEEAYNELRDEYKVHVFEEDLVEISIFAASSIRSLNSSSVPAPVLDSSMFAAL